MEYATTMCMRRLVGSCAIALLLLWSRCPGLGAAGSDVADAVMRGDTAAVRALLIQKADVNAQPGRRGDSPALGRVSGGRSP